MADQLLSVQDTSLQTIADAIRSKGGTNAALTFPDGFVSALNALDTYPAAQDKVAPAGTVTLTPSNTSYSIPSGVHDGTEVVRIVMENKTVNPDTQDHEYTLPDGKFFDTFTLNAMDASSGYQVAYGTYDAPSISSFTISVPFSTMIGALLMLQGYSGSSSADKIASLSFSANGSNNGRHGNDNRQNCYPTSETISFSNKVVTFSSSRAVFQGTYFYVIWGQ